MGTIRYHFARRGDELVAVAHGTTKKHGPFVVHVMLSIPELEAQYRAMCQGARIAGEDDIGSFGSFLKRAARGALHGVASATSVVKNAAVLVDAVRQGSAEAQKAMKKVYAQAKKGIPAAVRAAKTIAEISKLPAEATARIAVKAGEAVYHGALPALKVAAQTVTKAAPYAQLAISAVPGVGSGVSAAIAAGSALAQGKPITEAVVTAAKAAVPGGPLAAAALQSGLDLMQGGGLNDTALRFAREAIPNGEARKAFDVGVALAHGQNEQALARAV